jgi:hypothetical protein
MKALPGQEVGMRLLVVVASVCALLTIPLAARAETAPTLPAEAYEDYLDRLRYVCEVDCLPRRELLRTARKRGRGASHEMAGILDIGFVSEWNGKYLLHAGGVQNVDGRLGLTPMSFRPITAPEAVVVELDRQTFFDLLNVPLPGTGRSGPPVIDENGNIIVSRDRYAKFSRPTIRRLRAAFRDRRIVVRGMPRLEEVFVGGRLDYRRKKLFLTVDDPDNIVLLPRYDAQGNMRAEDLPWLAAARQGN